MEIKNINQKWSEGRFLYFKNEGRVERRRARIRRYLIYDKKTGLVIGKTKYVLQGYVYIPLCLTYNWSISRLKELTQFLEEVSRLYRDDKVIQREKRKSEKTRRKNRLEKFHQIQIERERAAAKVVQSRPEVASSDGREYERLSNDAEQCNERV